MPRQEFISNHLQVKMATKKLGIFEFFEFLKVVAYDTLLSQGLIKLFATYHTT